MRTLRRAAFVALVLGVISLGFGAVRASVALDRRLEETRFVVKRESCELVEWQRQVFVESCPAGRGDDGS